MLIGTLFISAISIALVVSLTFDSETITALRSIKLEYILASAIFHIFFYFVWGARTRALCKSLGYDIGYLKIVEIILSGVFVAGITPSSIGGEPLRIHMLYLNKIPFGRATAIILGERLLDAFLIFSSLPFALYIMRDILSNYKLDVALLTASCLAFFALILFIYGLCKPEKVENIILRVIKIFAPFLGKRTDYEIAHLIEHIVREMDLFHESLRILISEGKKGLFWGFFFTILFWTVEFFQLVLILMGLSKTPSILTVFASQILLVVVMIVPSTPGASGIAELGAATIFSVFVDGPILGVTVMAWRALTYYMNLLVGGFISLKVVKDLDLINKLIGKSTEFQRSTEKDI